MNGGVTFGLFKNFVPPVGEPILAPKSFLFWGLNIVTGGIYGSAETLSKGHRIKALQFSQEDLQNQAADLLSQWNDLEKELSDLLERLNAMGDQDLKLEGSRLKSDIDTFATRISDLEEESLAEKLAYHTSFSEVALGTISFVGQLISNILTIALYGVYQNYALKNRITRLEAENDFIKTQFDNQKEIKVGNLNKIIDSYKEFLKAKEDKGTLQEQYDGMKNTDQGRAYLEAQTAKIDLANLQRQHKDLENQATALKTQKATVEKDKLTAETELAKTKKEVQDLRTRVTTYGDDEWKLKKEVGQLKADLMKKDREIADVRTDEQRKAANLQVQLNAANAKAARVDDLDKKLTAALATQKHQPELVKLAAKLGPIAPKYSLGPKEDGEKVGAMDIDDIDEDDYEAVEIAAMKAYNNRYGDKRSATAVVEESFRFSYNHLLDMGKMLGKIKLNCSGETISTFGASAIYRYMALDLIRCGKVTENGCHGFQLKINGDVSMLPSQPENIIHYKDNQKGGFDPVVALHYKQRDDFTPDEEELRLRDGVNAPAARWIFDLLTDREKAYLFDHLMSPVIENNDPDYQAMVAFMKNKQDPRVKLIETASELIQDIATAMMKKFEKNVLIEPWKEIANDWDIKPFVKPEDDITGLDKFKVDTVAQVKSEKIVDWKLDMDVVNDKRHIYELPRQKDFADLIVTAQNNYQIVFQNFELGLLRKPKQKGEKINLSDWKDINDQYHVCHRMIGLDPYGNGGERCLFSNLLAVLITDKSKLTSDNVNKLRNSMANYLTKLVNARNTWNVEKTKPANQQSKDAEKLKEMAELCFAFEEAIKKTHNTTVGGYQNWLRKELFGVPPIDAGNLTTLEIQLAAFAIGVRIGVIPLLVKDVETKIDDFGRIVPDGEYYGPNTREFFLMGCTHGAAGGGTYYGLFPKLKTADNDLLEDLPGAFNAALEIDSYWSSIDMNNKGLGET